MQVNISNRPIGKKGFTSLTATPEQVAAVVKVASKRYSSQFPYRTYVKYSPKVQSMIFLSEKQRDRIVEVLQKK